MSCERAEAVDALPPLREVIDAHDLRAQKSLGQNFLLDMNITDKIVREAMDRDGGDWSKAHAIEIGPGPGGLTRALLKSSLRSVTAVEFDERAVNALQSLKDAAFNDLHLHHGDALKVDLLNITDAPRVIVANLPYNVATPLLIGWLRQIRLDLDAYQSMALMFQREVAERIVAQPNTKAYGRLAVISQWLCGAQIMYDLPPHAFTPPPKVSSSVVFFKPKKLGENAPPFETVERITAAAFNQRRKMIRSSLRDYMPAIEMLGIDPTLRAENLTVQQYLDIASTSL
jgi:16S rRNA (adenine1518-N6/adenine1519-N6)-dimethyltransferase